MPDARSPILPFPGGTAAPERGDAYAVVIGIDRYQDEAIRDLRYARADAQAVYDVLVDPHLGRFKKDNVTLLLDDAATRDTITSAIGTRLKRRAKKQDLVLVYFAGHGAPELDGEEKYLLPSNAKYDDLFTTAISMDAIQKYFGRVASERLIFFLDSCYSGQAGGRTFQDPRTRSTGAVLTDEFLNRLTKGKGRVVVTACDVNEVSLEIPELRHGIFTHYLVEGLKGKADLHETGFVTLRDLYGYVSERVEMHAARMSGKMKPLHKGTVQGTVLLTQYETKKQRQARVLHDQAQAAYEVGDLDEAARLWGEVLQAVPEHEGAWQGAAAIEQQREEARRREEAEVREQQRTLQRKQQVLLGHFEAGILPLDEYTRGMALLKRDPGELEGVEQRLRRYVDLLSNGKMPVAIYLDSIRLLTTEDEPVPTPTGDEEEPEPKGSQEPEDKGITEASEPEAVDGEELAAEAVKTGVPDIGVPAMAFVAIPERSWSMGKNVVTQEQWKAVMGTEPWKGLKRIGEGDDYSAARVSWEDAQRFIEKLNTVDRTYRYRLPVREEWDYAYLCGRTIENIRAERVKRQVESVMNPKGIDVNEYVRQLFEDGPNAWGLCDMGRTQWTGTQAYWGPVALSGGGRLYGIEQGRRDEVLGFRLVREAL